MAKQIELVGVTQGLKMCLIETFESVVGIYLDKGTSLFETLAQITAEQASQPMGNCATIAAHVEHITYYLKVIEDRMFNRDLSYVKWSEIWETVDTVSADEWTTMITNLKATYERVKGHFDDVENWDGDHELSCVFGMIVHSAYHLGEIRQMMCHLR